MTLESKKALVQNDRINVLMTLEKGSTRVQFCGRSMPLKRQNLYSLETLNEVAVKMEVYLD